MKKLSAANIAFYALMIAMAMILSYVETLIPFPFFMPGMKLGLANIVTMIVLYKIGSKGAAFVSVTRILLSALLFGNAFSIAYSLTGGALSLVVMALLKRYGGFGIIGVSAAGGVCHNIAQIGVAALLLSTGELLYYLPVLLVSGTVTGCLMGSLGVIVLKKLDRIPGNDLKH